MFEMKKTDELKNFFARNGWVFHFDLHTNDQGRSTYPFLWRAIITRPNCQPQIYTNLNFKFLISELYEYYHPDMLEEKECAKSSVGRLDWARRNPNYR